MPQNGHGPAETMRIVTSGAGSKSAGCGVQRLRPDIWLGVIPDENAAQNPFVVQSGEAVLALAFLVPRTGKGGVSKLPAGVLCMFPAGTNPLPELSGRGLILCITASRLLAILGPDAETLPCRVRALLAGKSGEAERIHVSLTPEQVLAGNALIQCPYEGAVRNIFFKSKVLELLAHFFGQVILREKAGSAAKLSPSDREIAAKARAFLLAHMDDPPGVRRIARHAGVNETKLKRLFKEAYGLSPYAYLRAERLAAARESIIGHGVNVSEAAASVGYSNISHFIEAFARRYGIRPGELRARKTNFSQESETPAP